MGKSGVDDEDDFEYDDDDDEGEEAVKSKAGGGSWFSSVLRNVVGKESLERSDVQPVLDQLKVGTSSHARQRPPLNMPLGG
eukprot:scaffold3768_cov376-Prasinococcus_capsulatus_cf.AAC.22